MAFYQLMHNAVPAKASIAIRPMAERGKEGSHSLLYDPSNCSYSDHQGSHCCRQQMRSVEVDSARDSGIVNNVFGCKSESFCL